ncbi:MAG: hypothetical protein ABL977_10125 [Candidatus Eisenbacteria bacterium]
MGDMDAIAAIKQTMLAVAAQQAAFIPRGPQALVNGEGRVVWQADTYSPAAEQEILPSVTYDRNGVGGT